ncbi:uncharacterized protein [Physcomitrium patens]|uniref:Large ribosomal subunit protein uL30m n=1 Tax=Physcomitrium patens TaxID=3218 RepID=A9T1C3_PHYPA|nr:uncharacterized protein LOC112277877 [Physcomitrium patens]|eukprot:XP_024366441.1 uncharacterized protein LOC112277877 [Physcomitrella patens]
MAGAAPAWTKRLVIQLVRGLPGTRITHRGTVRALGLRRRHQTVFRDATPSICGMINQVKRLVSVETEEMYNARLEEDANRKAVRPPHVIRHSPQSKQ